MSSIPSRIETITTSRILTWLHILGAALVVVVTALYGAVHSPLGQEISAGESPGFDWIRANVIPSIGFVLVYLILVCWLQIKHLRQSPPAFRLLSLLTCIEMVGIAVIALLLFLARTNFLLLVFTVLLVFLLLQALTTHWPADLIEADRPSVVSQKYSANTGLFLVFLFGFGAAISVLDPSWRRLSDQVLLDSDWEYTLRYLYPPVLSGAVTVWFGIAMMSIILGFRWLQVRINARQRVYGAFNFLTFFSLVAVFSAFVLVTLYHAIPWQIKYLNLNHFVWQLFIFFTTAGGILFSAVYSKIAPHIPQTQERSVVGIVALTVGAAIIFPVTWLIMSWRHKKPGWLLLSSSTIGICGFICYLLLFSDIFNPWFTAFSYLKGAMLKIVSMVAAGTVLLIVEPHFSFIAGTPSGFRRPAFLLAVAGVLGFFPFYTLLKHPEVKAVVLQYNELTRVDATFAREFANTVGLGKWIHIGQRPPQNGSPHPWPPPWRLQKTHLSLLPENFNLLVITVDALRGDAFHSAGYHRNLTPFLDRWSMEEALSFRRAYSQGGGSFAAYPFLVAGRSRLDFYGPGLYQQNLYFKIARAEGIQHYMLMKGFGPRDIFPPDLSVTELAIAHAGGERRSATADEVFAAARKAILALPANERFLSFLTLMDVHNDLWEKDGGTDFGDSPRDLYDNNLSYLDKAMSRFISWLKEEGIYDRTVILFTSDHGEQFWEHGASLHGHTVYEEEIRVPLILVSHAIRKRFEDLPVIAADMAPTLADMAGYSVEPPYDDPRMGISLLPLLSRNERDRYLQRDVVGRASFKRRYFIYRDWEWKLVYLAELDLLQLFNVIQDPLEKRNLIDEEPGLTAELAQELFDYLETVEGKTYRSVFFKN
jgi:hypothetical protein